MAGDDLAAKNRISALNPFALLDITAEVEKLADWFLQKKPRSKEKVDRCFAYFRGSRSWN